MFTKQHFILQAKLLGSHVIPNLCTRKDWNAGGALKWDMEKVRDFHAMGMFLVGYFIVDNPNFSLDKFNNKMLEHADVAISHGNYGYLARDLPGMRLKGKESLSNRWLFHPDHVIG